MNKILKYVIIGVIILISLLIVARVSSSELSYVNLPRYYKGSDVVVVYRYPKSREWIVNISHRPIILDTIEFINKPISTIEWYAMKKTVGINDPIVADFIVQVQRRNNLDYEFATANELNGRVVFVKDGHVIQK